MKHLNSKFEIRNLKQIPLIPFIKGGIIAVFLLTFFATQKLSAEVYIADDFTVTSSGFPVTGDVNTQIGNGRQTGTFAPLEYTWWPGAAATITPLVNSAGPLAGLCAFERGVSMNNTKNFNEITGGFFIEFDLIRLTNIDYAASVSFGKNYYWTGWQHPIGLDIVFNRTAGIPGYFIQDNAPGLDLDDTGPTKGYFQFPELAYETNPTLRVKLCVLQDAFPPTNYPRISLFLNGKPYPVYTNGTGSVFSHTITTKPTNNVIIINQIPPYDEAEIENAPVVAIDNYKIATLSDNTIGTASWTGDGNSGIDISKLYTHAVNFGEFGNSVINGLTFTGSGSNLYGSNWKLVSASTTSLTGPVSSYTEGKNPAVSGASLGLVSNFIKAADSDSAGALTISGLTPGLNYKLSVFSFGFEAAGGRSSYISTSDGIKFPVLDQDEFGDNGGQLLTYQYTAPNNGTFSFSTTPITPTTPAWNWFAFCNEVLPPDPPASISASQGIYSDKIEVTWPTVDSTEYYILSRADFPDVSTTNFAVQLFSNFYDDIVPAITFARDYYYWVLACNTGGCAIVGPALGFTKSENPPDSPIAVSPASLNIVTSPVEFVASVYNDNGGFAFDASQWQVSENPVFSPLKWDSGETAPPVNSIFAPQNKVHSGTNFWRVRYMNDRNTWSDWSNSNQFICVSGESQSGIFKDNFNVLPTGDINTDFAVSGRQSGEASPLAYTISGTTEIGGFAAYPGKLMLGQNAGCSPNTSFESSDKFNIEFDVELHNFDTSSDWLSLALGKDGQSSLLPDSESGLAAVFGADGTFKFYNGATLLHSEANAVPTAQELHVLVTASTDEFGEGEDAYCSVFVNGTPIPNSFNGNNKYAYTLAGGFDNNYVTMYNYNNAGTLPSLVDNLKISHAPTNVVTVHPWTGDTDSLIDPIKEYTHLVNISGDDVTLNGHEFIGTGILTNQGFGNGDPHYTTSTWALIDAANYLVAWVPEPPPSPNLTGSSFGLGQFGVIGLGSPAVVLSGLTPNSSNTLYLYSWAREDSTEITFPSSYGGAVETIDVDQYGQLNGIIIQYDYIADENGIFTVTMVPDIDHMRYFISGFANIETGMQVPQIDVDSMLCFGETALNILPLEIANIGGGIVDGTISGIEEPFSLSTNWYYAVPGTNADVFVTFSSTEERDYTNTITLTGNGGTTEVTLTGSGIPEPYLFIIYYLSFIIYYLRKK